MKTAKMIITTLVLISANSAFATACKAKTNSSLFASTNPAAAVKTVQTATSGAVQ